MIFIKYADKISQAYNEIKEGKYNKSIIENTDARIVIYRCGVIIRIDIKEL